MKLLPPHHVALIRKSALKCSIISIGPLYFESLANVIGIIDAPATIIFFSFVIVTFLCLILFSSACCKVLGVYCVGLTFLIREKMLFFARENLAQEKQKNMC